MSKLAQKCDVIVCGAGCAGLVAAIAAREAGARVLVLEKAPKALRGGNTYYGGGAFRIPIRGIDEVRELVPDLSDAEASCVDIEPYTPDQYYADVMRITEGLSEPELVQMLVQESTPTLRWMASQGVRWELNATHGVRVGGRVHYSSGGHQPVRGRGGGAGLSDNLFDVAEHKGAEIAYETKAVKLLLDDRGKVCGVTTRTKQEMRDLGSKAVILATGGFEGNREMRAKYLGKRWDLAKVRGSKFNTGDGLKMALDIGAQPSGQWTLCHGTQIDVAAPAQANRELGDKTHRRSFNLSIMVNLDGKRFVNEGWDFSIYYYGRLGQTVLDQPQRIAFQIYDAKVKHLLEARYDTGTCVTANSIEELGDKLGVDVPAFVRTVKEFNDAVQPGAFDYTIKDGKHTEGIEPPKSNWAQKLDTPPFEAYPVTCGVTLTYGGLKINREAQVLDTEDEVIPGLYASGIILGVFYCGYTGAADLPTSCVFGRIAGVNAAKE